MRNRTVTEEYQRLGDSIYSTAYSVTGDVAKVGAGALVTYYGLRRLGIPPRIDWGDLQGSASRVWQDLSQPFRGAFDFSRFRRAWFPSVNDMFTAPYSYEHSVWRQIADILNIHLPSVRIGNRTLFYYPMMDRSSRLWDYLKRRSARVGHLGAVLNTIAIHFAKPSTINRALSVVTRASPQQWMRFLGGYGAVLAGGALMYSGMRDLTEDIQLSHVPFTPLLGLGLVGASYSAARVGYGSFLESLGSIGSSFFGVNTLGVRQAIQTAQRWAGPWRLGVFGLSALGSYYGLSMMGMSHPAFHAIALALFARFHPIGFDVSRHYGSYLAQWGARVADGLWGTARNAATDFVGFGKTLLKEKAGRLFSATFSPSFVIAAAADPYIAALYGMRNFMGKEWFGNRLFTALIGTRYIKQVDELITLWGLGSAALNSAQALSPYGPNTFALGLMGLIGKQYYERLLPQPLRRYLPIFNFGLMLIGHGPVNMATSLPDELWRLGAGGLAVGAALRYFSTVGPRIGQAPGIIAAATMGVWGAQKLSETQTGQGILSVLKTAVAGGLVYSALFPQEGITSFVDPLVHLLGYTNRINDYIPTAKWLGPLQKPLADIFGGVEQRSKQLIVTREGLAPNLVDLFRRLSSGVRLFAAGIGAAYLGHHLIPTIHDLPRVASEGFIGAVEGLLAYHSLKAGGMPATPTTRSIFGVLMALGAARHAFNIITGVGQSVDEGLLLKRYKDEWKRARSVSRPHDRIIHTAMTVGVLGATVAGIHALLNPANAEVIHGAWATVREQAALWSLRSNSFISSIVASLSDLTFGNANIPQSLGELFTRFISGEGERLSFNSPAAIWESSRTLWRRLTQLWKPRAFNFARNAMSSIEFAHDVGRGIFGVSSVFINRVFGRIRSMGVPPFLALPFIDILASHVARYMPGTSLHGRQGVPDLVGASINLLHLYVGLQGYTRTYHVLQQIARSFPRELGFIKWPFMASVAIGGFGYATSMTARGLGHYMDAPHVARGALLTGLAMALEGSTVRRAVDRMRLPLTESVTRGALHLGAVGLGILGALDIMAGTGSTQTVVDFAQGAVEGCLAGTVWAITGRLTKDAAINAQYTQFIRYGGAIASAAFTLSALRNLWNVVQSMVSPVLNKGRWLSDNVTITARDVKVAHNMRPQTYYIEIHTTKHDVPTPRRRRLEAKFGKLVVQNVYKDADRARYRFG